MAIFYGYDYVAQLGTLVVSLLMGGFLLYVWSRYLRPVFERLGMVERVKMALYDVELERFCKENKIDYSKLDICLDACYKKKNGKLKQRLEEIEKDLL